MAECHPVGFQWVMEAKARGATVIHVDPRFTRTSAVADLHVPLRAGTDIAFLGGIVNHVLQNGKEFREYLLAYTNAATLVSEDFQDTEDLDGVFSGLDAEGREYDVTTWMYEGAQIQAASGQREEVASQRAGQRSTRRAARGEAHGSGGAGITGEIRTDETLEHPRCVYQILKRHFARYTPEMVERTCGVPQEQFLRVCELLEQNSGRERTTAFAYSVGWTHHTVGVQYVRTAAILQTLLGNIGRPGGGILALRGHASIQGSTDIPTLFNILPGYIAMPHADSAQELDEYVENEKANKGYWAELRSYLVSLLKAWWGDAATPDNGFCFDYLPRLTGSHSSFETVMAQIAGECKGYFLLGENPAVGSANGKMQRLGMANLDWLVVRDFQLIESATWWKDGPEIETGELRTEDIATEVFFLPAAAHTEKDGSFTNTQRMLQWHHQAVEPAGDTRSDLWFMYHLGRRIREKLAGSTDAMDRPVLDLTWDYPTKGAHGDPDADAVLAEINGWDGEGNPLSSYQQLKPDGSTACGCWIYCGCHAEGVNQPARRKPGDEQSWVAPEWGWAWPANRRILYNRASAAPDGTPWSERKAYIWWDAEQEKWVGHDVPDFSPTKAPDHVPAPDATGVAALSGTDAFIMQADGKAWLYAPAGLDRRAAARPLRAAGLAGRQPALRAAAQPRAPDRLGRAPRRPLRTQRAGAGRRRLPLRRHDLPHRRAPHRGRHEPLVALPRRARARPVLRGLTRARGRARAGARRVGHGRLAAQRHRGQGARHRPGGAAAGAGRRRAPDRAALPLGPQRPGARRRRQRPDQPRDGPERPHHGDQGPLGRHPAGPAAAGPRQGRARRGLPPAGRDRRGDRDAGARMSVDEADLRELLTSDQPPRVGFFTDTSVCIGCKACEVACKTWNAIPEDGLAFTGMSLDNTAGLGADTWRHVAFIEQRRPLGHQEPGVQHDVLAMAAQPGTPVASDEFRWLMSSDVCKHCTHAACLDVCPTGSLFRTEFGTVVVQEDICNGCGYCIPACPYGVIDQRKEDGRAWKCTLCYDRLGDGLEPACAKACPTESIQFGPLDELRERADARLARLHEAGVGEARLYGRDPEDGVGGAGAFFLLLDEPEVYGLPPDPVVTTRDLPGMWRTAGLAALALVGGAVAAFLGRGPR